MQPRPASPHHRWVAVVAITAYVAIGVFPYLVSGLLVPQGAVVVLMVCWFLGLIAIAVVARRRPVFTPLAVLGALLFWFAFVSLGSRLFGWTA